MQYHEKSFHEYISSLPIDFKNCNPYSALEYKNYYYVCYEFSTEHPDHFHNIWKYNLDGQLIWKSKKIELKNQATTTTSVFSDENGQLKAYAWDGFYCLLDPKTGDLDPIFKGRPW